MNNVSISTIDITQSQLDDWAGTKFDPSKFDLFGLEKNTMSDAVVKCLRHMNDISNSNIVHNAGGLLSRREVELLLIALERIKNVFFHKNLKLPIDFCFRDPL